MKKLYLHIGSPKTGTTSIQELLNNNRAELERQGYIYPGKDMCHHKFFFATRQKKAYWPRQFKGVPAEILEKQVNSYFSELLNEFQVKDGVFLVSTEYLFLDSLEAIENVLNILSKYFSDIEVLVFVRCPVGYYASVQQQLIKARSYIEHPELFFYNFKQVIRAWSKKARVTVFKHEPGVDSCKAFCDHVGVDFDSLSSSGQSNTSISVEQMMVLEKIQRELYANKEDIFKPHLGIVGQIKTSYFTRPRLKRLVKNIVYNRHYDDLEWLRKNHGFSFLKQERAREVVSSDIPENPRVYDIYETNLGYLEGYESALFDSLMKLLASPARRKRG